MKIKHLIICGPTATGKTRLAIQIAKEWGDTSIFSIDSRQAYVGLDIVSGKDTKDIYGLDMFQPNETANISEFIRKIRPQIDTEIAKGRNIILVGGTGLYLKALTENLSDIFVEPNTILRGELEKLSLTEMQAKLQTLNPQKFLSLNNSDKNNPRRLIRAIEIAASTKQSSNNQTPFTDFVWVGIKPSEIESNIKERVVSRLTAGAVEEVKQLIQKYPDIKLPIYTTFGVSQIIENLNNQIDENRLVDLWTTAETQYAKRQMVWFKKQPRIIWYDQDKTQLLPNVLNLFS